MTSRRRAAIKFTIVPLLLGLLASSADAAARYDPRLRFQTVRTPHFVILFHQGEERLAQRLAVIAEETHATLGPRFGGRSDIRTYVILVDQNDDSNGSATPLPYNTIEIAAIPPAG